MSLKSSHLVKVVLSASSLTLGLCAPLIVEASPANASSNLCQKVTPAEVSAALGVKATKVRTVLYGAATTCWYNIGPSRNQISVTGDIGAGTSTFISDRSQSNNQGDHPATDHHFAPNSAFSTWFGSPNFGYTHGVVILKKKNVLSVSAANVSLAKVESLAKKVLPLL